MNEVEPLLSGAGDLARAGRTDAAMAAYRAILRDFPDTLAALVDLAGLLKAEGATEEALCLAERARDLAPSDAAVWHNLATLRQSVGAFEATERAFARAVALAPELWESRMSWGMALLRLGRFAEGWREYEHRWRTAAYAAAGMAAPRWLGGEMPGGTLLLTAEQGFGDTLQFARYAALARPRVGRIVLACQSPLARLFDGLGGVDAIIPWGRPLPPYRVWCPLPSLPGLFGTEPATIPNDVPYLVAPRESREAWARRLGEPTRPRVGLAWRGNPAHHNDAARSLGAADLATLVAVTPVEWFGLQPGAACPPGVTDLSPDLRDFAETAAVVANLDLVIGVDTALVHLAGALGKPAWVLLPRASDWRWLADRDDSPWYPTVRLYRQLDASGWRPVIDRVRQDVERLAT